VTVIYEFNLTVPRYAVSVDRSFVTEQNVDMESNAREFDLVELV